MKFFIDSADVGEIREADAMGILDGVTTNPSLVAKTGRPFREVIDEIVEIVAGPVSAEVTATDFEGMRKEAKELSGIADNIVVKIPIIAEGLKAIRWCTDNGIRTNVTLCFNPLQALFAAKAGAGFISPFVGRLDDISHDGMDLIGEIRAIYDNYGFDTEILVASVRHPMHVVQSALLGADVVTVPFAVIKKLLSHPLTDIGLEKFLADWNKTQKAGKLGSLSRDRQDVIRELLLEQLAPGAPVSRGRLLSVVAGRLGASPAERRLRAEVARETRALESEGVLVDAGPEVFLADPAAERS